MSQSLSSSLGIAETHFPISAPVAQLAGIVQAAMIQAQTQEEQMRANYRALATSHATGHVANMAGVVPRK